MVLKREIALGVATILATLFPTPHLLLLCWVLFGLHVWYWKSTRWQVLPTLIALVGSCYLYVSSSDESWAFIAVQFSSAGLSCLSICAMIVFPMSPIPTPTGPFKPCRTTLHVDSKDADLHFNCLIYYPSSLKVGHAEPKGRSSYLKHGKETASAFAKFGKVPPFVMSHLALHSVDCLEADVEDIQICDPKVMEKEGVAGSKLPVVIFSPGLGGAPDCYQAVILELASRGIVVVAMEHNDASLAFVRLGNGQVQNYRWLDDLKMNPPRDVTKGPSDSDEATDLEFDIRHSQLVRRTNEILEVVRLMKLAISSSPSSSDPSTVSVWRDLRIDFDTLSIMGHSFGGATAVSSAYSCSDFKACISFDTWMFPLDPKIADEGLSCPLLIIESWEWRVWMNNYHKLLQLYSNSTDDSIFLTLPDTGHQSFSDFVVLSPIVLRAMNKAGSADPTMILHAISRYSMAYLRKFAGFDNGSCSRFESALERHGYSDDQAMWEPIPDSEYL